MRGKAGPSEAEAAAPGAGPEAAVKEAEDLFRATFERAAVGIAHVGRDGRWLRVNRRFCEITGYPEEELLRLSFQDITHPDDVARDEELTSMLHAGKIPHFHMEKRYLRKDGSVVWIDISVSPLPFTARYGNSHICVVHELTERKRLEETLVVANRRMKLLSELALRLLAAEKPGDAASTAFDMLARELDLHACFNYLMQEDGTMRLDSCHGIPRRTVNRLAALGGGVCGMAGNERAVHAPDGFCGERVRLLRRHGIRAFYCIPLLGQEGVLGTLSFGTRSRDSFSDDERDLLETVARYVGLSHQRLQTAAELQKSEERFRLAARATTDIIWDYDVKRGFVGWNEAIARFGHAEALPGTGIGWWEDHIHPEDRDRVLEGIRSALAGEALFWQDEYRFLHADSSFSHVLDRGTVIRDAKGNAVRMVGAISDMTDRLEAEKALRKSETQFRQLAEALPQFVWISAPDGRDQYLNRRWSEYTGTGLKEIHAGGMLRVVHPDDFAPAARKWEQSLATGEPFEAEYRLKRAQDGVYRWFLARAIPIRSDRGEILHWFGTCTDIEEQKRAKDAAEATARAKSDFMANMSHEIRTPMNGILGVTDLLLATNLTDLQRQYLDMVMGSAEALLAVVNDVLDFSKMEAGAAVVQEVEFDLQELVEKAAETLAVRAFQKGLELAVAVEPGVPLLFRGDAAKLRQVLLNLIGNGVKFTEKGEVAVRVAGSPSRDGKWELAFSVSDTGIGIPPDKIGMLFQSFTQLDPSTGRSYGGTGLGLAISRRIVEIMGGEIGVESRPGRGSVFSFRVELSAVEKPAAPHLPAELAGLRALVLDDNETNRLMLRRSLSARGMQVDAAGSGSEALSACFAAADAGAPYDFVVIDLHLPDMDGFQVARRLGKRYPLRETAVMMITSDDLAGGTGRCNRIGIAHVAKPVRIARLVELLAQLKKAGDGHAPPPPEELPSLPLCMQVLVAEDNPVNLTVTEAILRSAGAQVTAVTNGAEAVKAFAAGRFNVVLMDVQMPEMDGYEATRMLRARGAEAPIIGLTAHALEGDRERCLAAGMDDYLAKPVTARLLNETVARWARLRPIPAADTAPLLEQLGGERESADIVVATFLENAPEQLAEVREAARTKDAPRLERGAHRLKGAVTVVAAETARCLAEKLEAIGGSGELRKAPAVLAQLETELERVLEELRDNVH